MGKEIVPGVTLVEFDSGRRLDGMMGPKSLGGTKPPGFDVIEMP